MGMIKWVKPSGLKIETNDKDETVEYCESLGWKKSNGRKPKENKSDASASGAVTDTPNESNR